MKREIKSIAFDYLIITLGLIIAAAGIRVFLVPAKIAAGGVSGISVILYHKFKIQVGWSMLVMNIPLFLLGLKNFGKGYGLKTLYGTVALSFFVEIIDYLFPHIDTLIDYSKGGNMLLAPIYGGVVTGLGIGLVMKYGGSTGGTDIVAQVLSKYTKIPTGYAMMTVDSLVIISATFVFGWEAALYAIICLYATGIFIHKTLEGVSYTKMVLIISDEYDRIKDMILNDIERGGTGISANGLYTNNEKRMILTVLDSKEIHELREFIKVIDSKAFVIVTDIHEVYGEGFTPINK
ncbi:MAG: YitT family protein [Fusobacteriaceae bacterium]|nr:YitT family protein [Fusobacteriaceae bacterium]MBN2838346.1 YitT family protein [Fusobacteriaceae bacterium]